MSVLHGLDLPDITRECLTDIVYLQIDLLNYAASTLNMDTASCAKYIQENGTRLASLSCQVAEWFFDRRATKRKELLGNFARAYQKKESKKKELQKTAWLERIRQETTDLFCLETNTLVVLSFFDEITPAPGKMKEKAKKRYPEWQKAASEFFLYFYTNYVGTDEKFPANIFTHFNEHPFGRQEILAAFLDKNKGLEICAICDQARYYTHGLQKTYSILDHYFPKESYPHFSCHPYNLIPVCYACNSAVKGTRDPFLDKEKHRRSLSKNTLPYRHNLSQHVYLEVTPGENGELLKIGKLHPRSSETEALHPDVIEAISLLQDIYQLPDRWQYADQAIRISDILFRRMRHFMDDGRAVQHGTHIDAEIDNNLRQLFYYLATEDQRRDPFGFTLTWMLGSFLKEKEKQSPTWKGLVAEINSWSGQSLDKSKTRDSFVENLLKMIPKPD